MNPKNKALELIEKFRKIQPKVLTYSLDVSYDNATANAILAVEEILLLIGSHIENSNIEYWGNVLEELRNF